MTRALLTLASEADMKTLRDACTMVFAADTFYAVTHDCIVLTGDTSRWRNSTIPTLPLCTYRLGSKQRNCNRTRLLRVLVVRSRRQDNDRRMANSALPVAIRLQPVVVNPCPSMSRANARRHASQLCNCRNRWPFSPNEDFT